MRYYSTNHTVPKISLKEAVLSGLAGDKGLFMPERVMHVHTSVLNRLHEMNFQDIALEAAKAFFKTDMTKADLKVIIDDTLTFDCPVVHVRDNIYSLELYHGPTLAFKDVGARFMARLLAYFLQGSKSEVKVLVATSGDTGSAVANGFLRVSGIHVYVLYPKGLVSEIQERQFTTLGENITALEVDGSFDDCQRLVKTAFLDEELRNSLTLTSANSINIARFFPQSFYYFNAVARLREMGINGDIVFSVPSGNFGNLTAGLVAKRMGLQVKRFMAANNENDVVYQYLKSGVYSARPSVPTIANAMDVGDPSNFARILDLYKNSHEDIKADIAGFRYSDEEIKETVRNLYKNHHYLADPHGAVGYRALCDGLKPDETGVFLETAHPAKFIDTMEDIVEKGIITIPEKLMEFMDREKQSIPMSKDFDDFKEFLLS